VKWKISEGGRPAELEDQPDGRSATARLSVHRHRTAGRAGYALIPALGPRPAPGGSRARTPSTGSRRVPLRRIAT